jgi:5-methylcytosine-specific restriction endonuclease McrA
MVHREKDFLSPPPELLDAKWDSLKADLLITTHSHKLKVACYRDTTIESLMTLYNDKCAICERLRGTELEIDHYRPKKERNNNSGTEYNQTGYYWLAYEWSNLIPLCSKCNKNKSNKFPLRSWDNTNRISSHNNINTLNPFNPYNLDWLQSQELPLMINPEFDKNPERHFIFHSNGRVVGRTEEGDETIKICKLNRKDLIRERLKICEKYANSIKLALVGYNDHKNRSRLEGELEATFKKIKLNSHIDESHSYYNLFIYRYYHHFIDLKLPVNLRGISTKYFNQFKNK